MKREFVTIDDLVAYHRLWTDFLNGLQLMICSFIYFDKLISLIKKVPSQGNTFDLGEVLPPFGPTIMNWLNTEEVQIYF